MRFKVSEAAAETGSALSWEYKKPARCERSCGVLSQIDRYYFCSKDLIAG
jgi:hypothetical protein